MKLTPEQQLEKKAREAIKRLINRVSSEYSFKKWRNLHGYLHSIGRDDSIAGTQDKELTRPELDELLRQYEEAAFATLQKPGILPDNQRVQTVNKELQEQNTGVTGGDSKVAEPTQQEEKFTDKNNYGLSKSSKESVVLFWFQKKASAELLKGFNV